MKIGIDIDNTILDYSRSFRKHGESILGVQLPEPISKSAVQQLVVESKGENAWTELQGVVYSEDPLNASVFEGFTDFLAHSILMGAEILYVSHKTSAPVLGPKKDIRTLVINRLNAEGIISPNAQGAQVVFCETMEEKVQTIKKHSFNYFIDDLQKVLEPLAYSGITCLHFRCECANPSAANHISMANWKRIEGHVFGES